MRIRAIPLSLFFAMVAKQLVANDERAVFPTNLRHEWTVRTAYSAVHVQAMCPAQDQLFYAGAFYGLVEFDYGPGIDMRDSGLYNNADLFVSAMGLDGSYHWTYSAGGLATERAHQVVADSHENVTVVGEFYGVVDFDPGPGEAAHGALGSFAAFIVRLDDQGVFQWSRSLGGRSDSIAYALDVDSEGNVILGGNFGYFADLDPGPGEYIPMLNRFNDVFVVKLDTSGSLVWAKAFGGGGWDSATDLAVGPEDEVVVVGSFRYSVDFDPGPGVDVHFAINRESGWFDVFITKFKADGSYLWTRTMQTGAENPRVEVGLDGAVICAGRIDNDADMDPTEGVDWRRVHVPNVYTDGYVTKLGPDGSYHWTYMISGSEYEYVFEHQVLDSGEIIAVGTYRGVLELPAEVGLRRLECNAGDCGFRLSLSPDGRLNWALSSGYHKDYLLSASQNGIFLHGGASIEYLDRLDVNITCEEEAEYGLASMTKLQYGPPRGGDVDFDGDVDLRDVARFYQCYTGDPRDKHNDPLQVDCGAGCDEFDLSPDAVLDRDDYALLLKRFEGPK